MPTGIMIPTVHLASEFSRYGVFSHVALNQASLLMDQQQLNEEPGFLDQVLQPMPDVEHRIIEDDFDGTPAGTEPNEGASGDEQDRNPPKRKRYHRHTAYQIQRLEEFFKECPHPDDRQRKELSRELGLEPLQVKFWFQNKRTQTKNQNERQENQRLKEENDRLLAENLRFKEALSSACCPSCGGSPALGEMSFDEHQLRFENARLRDEIDRISSIAAKYAGKPVMSPSLFSPGPSHLPFNSGFSEFDDQPMLIGSRFGAEEMIRSANWQMEVDRPFALALAEVSLVELIEMAQHGEPLWIPSYDGSTETLNEEEYAQRFPGGLGPKMEELRTEVSREVMVVSMNCERLVDIFMDASDWTTFFTSIVSSATTVEVYTNGPAGDFDGALQLMTAEFQVPTPLVSLREGLFLRYCKQHDEGLWAIVDVSMEVRHNPIIRFRRRPSGCLIEELPNGYSRVTWVEHVEVSDKAINNMYKPVVHSGLAFGAQRWVATLARQCERLESLIAISSSSAFIDVNHDATRNILKLAERMITNFCTGVSGSAAHHWITVSGNGSDDVKVRSRKNNGDPGRPAGTVLNASTSFWLPVNPKRIFDFLRSETSRNEVFRVPEIWDILLKGGMIHEVATITNGQEQGNGVSILCTGDPEDANNMMILQESWFDATCSYIIYAPVDVAAMNAALSGGGPNFVALLPSGFAILPDGMHGGTDGDTESSGSLLTVSFQILVDSGPDSKISLGSIATVNSLVSCTCKRIKAAVLGSNDQ